MLYLACLLALSGSTHIAWAQTDTSQARVKGAEALFKIALYRELATRQVYEALRALPEPQYSAGVKALSDPKVVQVLKQIIVRSSARNFSVAELQFLHRTLSSAEARSVSDKVDALRADLLRELFAAALTSPELAPLLAPQK